MTTDNLARSTRLLSSDDAATLEDNCFDLLPQETYIKLNTHLSPDDFKKTLTINSPVDAFYPLAGS